MIRGEEVHSQTETALVIAAAGAFLGGYVAASADVSTGILVSGFAAVAALAYTPDAETVASEWLDAKFEEAREMRGKSREVCRRIEAADEVDR